MYRITLIALVLLTIPMTSVSAETTGNSSSERFSQENLLTRVHPEIHSFSVFSDGSAYGVTEDGIPFSQVNVPNEYGIRVQQFTIEDHSHFIIGGKEVYSLTALSVALAEAYIREVLHT